MVDVVMLPNAYTDEGMLFKFWCNSIIWKSKCSVDDTIGCTDAL